MKRTKFRPARTTATQDSFQNFQAGLGIGAANQISNSTYGFNPVSRNRTLLEWMYRGSWLVGMAVDAPAEDMTRAGIDIDSTLTPEDDDALQAALQDLGIWSTLAECIKWARLYGGALGYLMIDGQDPATPLDLDTIGEGQFKGIMPLDRWMVAPSMSDLVTDLGRDYGQPKYYQLVQDRTGSAQWPKIHHSRVLRFIGIDLPNQQRMTENGWGESVIERIYDRLVSYDSTTAGAAQLVYKAHLRIMKVENLRGLIAAGGPAMAGLTAQLNNMRLTQANEGITLLDTTDVFDAQSYSFSGLSDMMLQFGQQISGALQIPLVRLFGQSPGGLNSSGESDLRTYYDQLSKQQEMRLRGPLVRILDVMARSVLGEPLPKGFRFRFNPLWLVRETERSTIGQQTTDSVIKAFEAGMISQAVALKELRQASGLTGLFTNISDEDIADADDAPPKAETEADDPHDFLKPSSLGGMDRRTVDGEFEESKHPRAANGEFSSSGGGAKSQHLETAPMDRAKWPEHIRALKLPPAWKDVRISHDPEADLQATGRDAKGRPQYVYSQKFKESQSIAKFERIRQLQKEYPAIEKQVSADQRSGDRHINTVADCMALVMGMGVRPGSENDTGADKKAYGATTLRGEHVIIDGKDMRLSFVGKKGVQLDLHVTDPKLRAILKQRAEAAGPEGRLFPGVSDKRLLDYAHSLGSGHYKTKDFRTRLATSTAHDLVKDMPVPANQKAYDKATKAVGKQVSEILGNTPTIALQSYIDPTAFSPWRDKQ